MLARRLAPGLSTVAHLRRTSTLTYVQRIKLLQAVREDDSRCADLLRHARFLPFLSRRPLVGDAADAAPAQRRSHSGHRTALLRHGSHSLRWLSLTDLQSLCPVDDVTSDCVLLHVADTGQLCFAVALPDGSEVAEVAGRARHIAAAEFADPRHALFLLPWEEAHTMSQAFALLNWRAVTRFCARCGAELRTRTAGHTKQCPACEAVQYPTTPPVGITMVTDADQTRALLVRQGRHPPGMYSCVAGFLEPGETIESCIRREVAEEVGLELSSVRYASSQHWPFSGSSLMVGCYALTEHTELDLDRDELEDARWFSVEEIRDAYQRIVQNPLLRLQKTDSGGLWIPPEGTIAHRLIRAWLSDLGRLT